MSDREVVILGVGLHKFGRFPDESLGDLSRAAGEMAFADAGVGPKDIQMGFCAHLNQPVGTGTQAFGSLGITGIRITNVEVACASSSRSVILAAEAILAGMCDMCMVIGVEKMQRGLISMGQMDWASLAHEARLGLISAPSFYALKANWHMDTFGTKHEHFAQASVIAHKNGCLNPYAQHRKEMTLEEIVNSRMISTPITLYECSPTTDGASAVIICSKEKARQYTANPVLLAGWNGGSPIYVKGKWQHMLEDAPTKQIAEGAYEMAGIGPSDVDVVQVHDAFSPGLVFECEELGFCEEGDGGLFVWEGNTEIGGKIPINTDGGLMSRGHPIGATGGAMITELTRQLRGQAESRQVKGAKVGLMQNSGAGGGNVIVLKT